MSHEEKEPPLSKTRRASKETRSPASDLLVPLEEIEEDPNQPRKKFPRDSLEELAGLIEDTAAGSETPWIDGLLHPVVVYPSPAFGEESGGPRLRLLVGARRLRAYRHRGWPLIPVREVKNPGSVARTIMTQLNENDGREDTTLFEDARAVADAFEAWRAENPDGKQQDFAKAFGRSKFYVSRHLRVAQASGIPLQALEEGHLNHAEAYRLFVQLPVGEQSGLLKSARKGLTPISVGRVRAVKRRLEQDAKEVSTSKGLTEGKESASTATPKISAPRGLVRLELSPKELRRILDALGAIAPKEDSELVKALRATLEAF